MFCDIFNHVSCVLCLRILSWDCPSGYSCNMMLYIAKSVLVMAVTWYCTNPITTLSTSFTRPPLLGYRCILDDPSTQTTLMNITRAKCVWKCLSRDLCKVISYNHRLNSCELSRQLCDKVDSHAYFSINVSGTHRPLCSHWVPISEFDQQRAVVFPQKPVAHSI